ncbi:hypothetical protein [Desulfosoma caldarium]|uniref:Uncharacterized protein n=1 Tax=Desulfosoma caldarium TaxID=610254 RepID=A0A3N1VKI9_9BACT|nr:hypothetical protein [Desulfosoma caldarium]ROR03325.1 hypothetical protein EDC27_0593 [Desulfosoma caldarium]
MKAILDDIKMGSLILALLAAMVLPGCNPAAHNVARETGVVAGPHAPTIDGVFAVSSMWLGKNWEIFVAGSDPDGDMDYIWAEVSQLGGHMWDQHQLRLTGSQRTQFRGVITLPTPSFQSRKIWETLRVTLRIRDAAGHYSDPVTLEVELGKPTRESIPESWQDAREHSLGVIFFDFDMDYGEHSEDFKRW